MSIKCTDVLKPLIFLESRGFFVFSDRLSAVLGRLDVHGESGVFLIYKPHIGGETEEAAGLPGTEKYRL